MGRNASCSGCVYVWKSLWAGQTFTVVSASWGMSCTNSISNGKLFVWLKSSFPHLFFLNILYKHYRVNVNAVFALRPGGMVSTKKVTFINDLAPNANKQTDGKSYILSNCSNSSSSYLKGSNLDTKDTFCRNVALFCCKMAMLHHPL